MAKCTMRRDRPPAFMISPASMKKGTASSGKLLAPSITFCARICASNMSMCHIRAAPQASSEKAIGTPRAMAPSSAPRKMVMVMVLRPGRGGGGGVGGLRFPVRNFVLGLGDADQLALGELAGDQLPEVVHDEQHRKRGKEDTGRIEPGHGGFHHCASGA